MLKLYSWADKRNFGDELSKDVVEWVGGVPTKLVGADTAGKLLAVGSILQKAALERFSLSPIQKRIPFCGEA
jgi:hypothetical protein